MFEQRRTVRTPQKMFEQPKHVRTSQKNVRTPKNHVQTSLGTTNLLAHCRLKNDRTSENVFEHRKNCSNTAKFGRTSEILFELRKNCSNIGDFVRTSKNPLFENPLCTNPGSVFHWGESGLLNSNAVSASTIIASGGITCGEFGSASRGTSRGSCSISSATGASTGHDHRHTLRGLVVPRRTQ